MPMYSPIMVALCFMLLVTYYASIANYANIIGLGITDAKGTYSGCKQFMGK